MQTAQDFLNDEGIEICGKRSRSFGKRFLHSAPHFYTDNDKRPSRLRDYLKLCRHHVLTHLMNDTATCRPLYDSFNANRVAFCRQTVDPLNGLWFVILLCVTFWIMVTPLALALAGIYQKLQQSKGLRHTSSHQYAAFSCIILPLCYFACSIM